MILKKMTLAKEVLEDNAIACGDGGAGEFLNEVSLKVCVGGLIDFNDFNVGAWLRARRKILELNPYLDRRTKKTKECEDKIKKEVR